MPSCAVVCMQILCACACGRVNVFGCWRVRAFAYACAVAYISLFARACF